MHEQVVTFQERLRENLQEAGKCCYVTRARCFQYEAVAALEELRQEAEELREQMVKLGLENEANAMLSFTKMIEAIMSELRMWLSLRDEQPNQAWDYLVDAQMATRDALQAHDVASSFENYVNRLDALEHLIFPPQLFMSMSYVLQSSVCSICGSEYGECDHLTGKAYMGELCHRIVVPDEIRVVSLVLEPANKHCRVMRFGEGNHWWDAMTWLPVEDSEGTAGPNE